MYLSTGYEGFFINTLPELMNLRGGFCNQLIVNTKIIKEEGLWFEVSGNNTLYLHNSSYYDASLEDGGLTNWKAHLSEHPLVIMTYLDEFIEIPLTEKQIQAYKNIAFTEGTNIVSNDKTHGCPSNIKQIPRIISSKTMCQKQIMKLWNSV